MIFDYSAMKRAVIFVVLLSGPAALAEDPARGRLPDGRAFRTDDDGNQLVDYIAELEVQNESLKRRVNALDYENQQKQGGPPAPRLVEPEQITVPQTDDSACKTQLTMAQEAASSARLDLELQRKKFDEQLSGSQQRIAQLEQQLAASTMQVKSAENAAAQVQAESKAVIARANEMSAEAKAAKASAATEIEAAQAATRLAAANRVPVSGTASLDLHATERKSPPMVEDEPRARFEAGPTTIARDRAMTTVRGSISTELNKLKSLIAQRDRLFADYNRNRPAVTLKVSALRSSRDMTLNDIERIFQSAESVYQLTAVRADINELRGTINEDIGLVQRMSRSR